MKMQIAVAARRIAATGAMAAIPFVLSSPAKADDAAPATAAPPTTAPAGTYTWTWKHTKGQVEKVQMVFRITGEIPGTDRKFETVITQLVDQTVSDVADNGDVTLEQTGDSVKLTVNGDEKETAGTPAPSTVVLSKQGLVLKFGSNSEATNTPVDKINEMASMTPLPDHPVKVGESWTTEVDNRLMPGTKVAMTSTLQRIVSQNGVDILKIHSQMLIPKDKDGTTIKASSNYNVDPTKGEVVSSTSTADNVDLVVGKMIIPVHSETTRNLLSSTADQQGGPGTGDAGPQGGAPPQPAPPADDPNAQ